MDVKEVVGLKLVFNDVTIRNVDIPVTPDWVKWLWTSPDQLNITIIEFSATALTVLSRMKYARLISATPQSKKWYVFCMFF